MGRLEALITRKMRSAAYLMTKMNALTQEYFVVLLEEVGIEKLVYMVFSVSVLL